ncbi:GNAT family N-acetyltransferase [Niveibacterium sp. 24ML]|uniref:GNAT family N-acetyltransferase n=1 Tax=Niveibacterium sp. 24ML TaxID=2985512 RepID=UPI00226F00D0|nr:GNAT family N-acetyltransferase [Niveibacterium sp. 24ML]MCX9156078.1 GNAT family N-acetyltransferase [Niveibacterium sp. 24ML]
MSTLTLRPVREDELALLAEILAELDGDAPEPLDRVRHTWEAMQAYPDYHCYFAEAEGVVVGTLSLIVFPVFSHRLARDAIVEAVVIRPSFRGKGFGRSMLQAAIELAGSKGAYKLALSSNLRRLDAHRFYDGMGFARHGVSFAIETTA